MDASDTVEIYLDQADEWRWRRKAPNGRILADSGEGYASRLDAVKMAERINGGAYVTRFVRRND